MESPHRPPIPVAAGAEDDPILPSPTLRATLQLIVDKLAETLTGSLVNLSLLDEANERIMVVAHHGLPSVSDGSRFPAHQSLAYHAMTSGRPISYSDVFRQTDFPAAHESARAWGFRSVLCVPLPLVVRRYALLLLHPNVHEFGAEEISYATALANQAAVAIRNAQLYEQQLRLVHQLTELNSVLEREKRELQDAIGLHGELTDLLVNGGGVEEIASTLARLVERAVVVEDRFLDFVAYARADGTWTLDEAEMDPPLPLARFRENTVVEVLLRELAAQRRPRYVAALPSGASGAGRIIAPIVAGPECLGYLSVLGVEAPPAWLQLVAVERAAAILAVELLKQKAVFDAELRVRSSYLDELLARPDQETLRRRARALGFDLRRPFSTLLVGPDPLPAAPDAFEPDPAWTGALQRTVERVVQGLADQQLILPRDEAILVLATLREPLVRDPLLFGRTLQEEVRRRWSAASLSVAVGPLCTDWRELPQVVAEVGRALQALRKLGPGRVADLEQLGVFGLVLEGAADLDVDRFCDRMLAPLEAHDRSRAGELVGSLRTYLDCNGNARRTARALNVHINTVRHRLEQVESLTGRQLDDPETRLNFQLALRLSASREARKTVPIRTAKSAG